jgi:zinc/manganese transport system permease protein
VHYFVHFESVWLDQLAATGGALLISLCIAQLVKKQSHHREAVIGLVYVAGACLAMLGASQNPHGREKLMHLLAADILWVDTTHAGTLLLCGGAMLWLQRTTWIQNNGVFYAIFALIASLAVPALGLFLVFSMLITPALWVARGLKPWLAMISSMIVALLGLGLSWLFDLPSGSCIAIILAVWGIASLTSAKSENQPKLRINLFVNSPP